MLSSWFVPAFDIADMIGVDCYQFTNQGLNNYYLYKYSNDLSANFIT